MLFLETLRLQSVPHIDVRLYLAAHFAWCTLLTSPGCNCTCCMRHPNYTRCGRPHMTVFLCVPGLLGDASTEVLAWQPSHHLLQASRPDIQSPRHRHGACTRGRPPGAPPPIKTSLNTPWHQRNGYLFRAASKLGLSLPNLHGGSGYLSEAVTSLTIVLRA